MIDPSKLPDGYQFHHIGYATKSIEQDCSIFHFLGYQIEGDIFTDPLQGVKGVFLTGFGPRIELLENLPNSEILTPWIIAGIKMYHLAYCVEDLPTAIDWARTHRAKIISPPLPSIAFGGKLITFVIFRNGLMLELIEQ
jgi:methylmalonyl-CoA/ethylmalonyl-CoA epimerase